MRAHFLSTCSPRSPFRWRPNRAAARHEFHRAWAQYVEAMKLEALKLVIAERWHAEHKAEA